MKLMIMENHSGEGIFPSFEKGTEVTDLVYCENTPDWWSCEINGYKKYIPENYLENNTLIKDYNPTELVVEKNKIVSLLEVAFEWLFVKDENNNYGWIPSNKVISV